MAFQSLPNFRLSPHSGVARPFLERGLPDFHRAARHVWLLPYGRTSPPHDYMRVLPEGRGTCATKHALLAALAHEHGAHVQLVMGVYEMDGENTPGVGATLARHGLPSILEAHCYLVDEGERVDLTRPARPAAEITFLYEEPIQPEQIGEYKRSVYRRLLWDWAEARGVAPGTAWSIREACIAALAEPPDPASIR